MFTLNHFIYSFCRKCFFVFSVLYCYWFNRYRNVLKDTGQQVEYTRNEENIHALAGIMIVNTIREEHPELFDEELEERITRGSSCF